MPLSAVQLLDGSARFVEARTPNTAPGLLVKENWNELFDKVCALVSVVVAGAGTEILTTLEVLWMPVTKTVASA